MVWRAAADVIGVVLRLAEQHAEVWVVQRIVDDVTIRRGVTSLRSRSSRSW